MFTWIKKWKFLNGEYIILLNNKFNGGKVGNINIKKYYKKISGKKI